ncbi:hypothetical protein ACWFZ6_23775 [Methylorubrum extorquens]|jgi:hypothetical protein|uniref:hypothetical protein n=1 Tax=Methylorubrum TaxID=2282523 RepID=UPI000A560F8A|nr:MULTISPECIES: hypothetical protein [Methylorubrum]MDF9861358.1 hypothetical protein [Methylorubrum pseudosasae]MDH6634985.1 hypothetical protein [Methylobacterium sp. SuP10 SLI 274]MDH6664156.1 hypothetical protein [Methylorubrum zatmanii]MCP1535481.1 hypothetical protein [Methylorubrum extorquens]MCP1561160.1 hypothetical protein [Methylorubrum extorquens]
MLALPDGLGPRRSTVPSPCADVELWLKDAHACLFIWPSTRISPVVTDPGNRPHARSEITIGLLTTFARETPEEVMRSPCVEQDSP